MADSTSVGIVQLDVMINPKSLNGEINRIGRALNSSFKNIFSGMVGQSNSFAKDSIGKMTGGFKNFAKAGENAASGIDELKYKLKETEVQIERTKDAITRLTNAQSKGFTGVDYEGAINMHKTKLVELEQTASNTRTEIDRLGESTDKASKGFKNAEKGAEKTSRSLKRLGGDATKASTMVGGLAAVINRSFRSILRRLFIYNLMLKGIRGIMSYTGAALKTNKQFASSLNIIKTNLMVAFQPIYDFILPALNALMRGIATATTYIASAISALFGKTYQQSFGAAKSLDAAKKSMTGYGKAAKKAQGQLAGFDEINQLDISEDDVSGGAGSFEMAIPEMAASAMTDTNAFFDRVNSLFHDLYKNWGLKDLFEGFRKGLELIDFNVIGDNFKITVNGLGEIAKTYLKSMQPIFHSAGQAFGNQLKYGVAIIGNLFEPVSQGFANFVTNMKDPIQNWISEMSSAVSNGFNNLADIFEILGTSWLNSVNKYKGSITKAIEDTMSNIFGTLTLVGTMITDTFEVITEKVKEYYGKNKEDAKRFTDSILQIFTDAWGLVNEIWDYTLGSLKAGWDEWGRDIIETLMNIVLDVWEWVLHLWNDLVMPIWDYAMEWLRKIWDESLKGIIDEAVKFVGKLGELIKALWENILKPLIDKVLKILVPVFDVAFKYVLDIVGSTIKGIGDLIKNLLKILNGIIDFLVGVFTGDWEKAWQGVSDVFKGIVDGLVDIFKIPLNWIISGINAFIRGLNKIKIPDWVPGVGGKGFSIVEIPHLAKGGIIDQPTLAMVGERGKEAVVPLENNTEWMERLASILTSAMMAAMQMVNVGSEEREDRVIKFNIDGTTFARIIIPYINSQRNRIGEPVIQPI